jgi:hypothetical protein
MTVLKDADSNITQSDIMLGKVGNGRPQSQLLEQIR